MRVCVGVWRRSTRGSPGAHCGEAAGCWPAALGIPRRAGGRGGFAWSCPRGADVGAALGVLMAKPLAQPDCGGAPRRTNASDSAAGESGAGKKGPGEGAAGGGSCSLCAHPWPQPLVYLCGFSRQPWGAGRARGGGRVCASAAPAGNASSACEAAAAAGREAAELRCTAETAPPRRSRPLLCQKAALSGLLVSSAGSRFESLRTEFHFKEGCVTSLALYV